MNKYTKSILGVAVIIVSVVAGYSLASNEPSVPDTAFTTEKANVDDGQTSDGSDEANVASETLPTNDQLESNEITEQTVVVPELELPEGGGIPVDTNHFKIEEVKSGTYLITLYAIINSPSQYAEYQQQLKDYKAEALEYLENNNIDADTITINYSPEEAADL